MGNAARIQAYRERLGKAPADIAALAGMSIAEYLDLELYDNELEMVPSLRGVKELADALQVSPRTLLADVVEDGTPRRIQYAELVARTRTILGAGISQEQLEDEVGWRLDGLLANEERALAEYSVDALKALCARLGINWLEALPGSRLSDST